MALRPSGLPALVLAIALFFASCGHKDTASPTAGPALFPRDVTGLDPARPMETLELRDGDTLRLTAAPVKKVLNGREARMLAYNGSIPGPLVKVPQGASITLVLANHAGLPTSLHSHGVRLDAASDGVFGIVADGATGTFPLRFPDAGIYWYHSHEREDYSQEMGLYGNYYVVPRDSGFWKPVDREVFLMIDDVLTDSGGIVAFPKDRTDYAMMGRFGNEFLVNGDTDYVLDVKRNELIRFYVTNACNARVLQLGFRNGGNLKVVGGDNGPYQAPRFAAREFLAPGERAVMEAYFNDPGTDSLIHETPAKVFGLARIRVSADSALSGRRLGFYSYDTNAHAIASIDSFRADFDRPPDKVLVLTARMAGKAGASGMGAEAAPAKAAAAAHDPAGLEWEDATGGGNAAMTSDDMVWIVRDSATGKENHDIAWTFKRGDRVKIRIHNDPGSMHPMPHPIHFHGQRFLVTAIGGMPDAGELGWKDTHMVGIGETTDLLVDMSNPGAWMAHCHIAEHLEAGMMFRFTVEP
jgi:FtsP/CotA-like multicopper oxidase with cupredoxin domain